MKEEKDESDLTHSKLLSKNCGIYYKYLSEVVSEKAENFYHLMGVSQAVRHRVLIPAFAGSNPASPAAFNIYLPEGRFFYAYFHIVIFSCYMERRGFAFGMLMLYYRFSGIEDSVLNLPEFLEVNEILWHR